MSKLYSYGTFFPLQTKDFDSLDKFKISLSTFLRRFPDKPPVTGYSTANQRRLVGAGWQLCQVSNQRTQGRPLPSPICRWLFAHDCIQYHSRKLIFLNRRQQTKTEIYEISEIGHHTCTISAAQYGSR